MLKLQSQLPETVTSTPVQTWQQAKLAAQFGGKATGTTLTPTNGVEGLMRRNMTSLFNVLRLYSG